VKSWTRDQTGRLRMGGTSNPIEMGTAAGIPKAARYSEL
jgi:hypothetical protein